MKTVFSGMQPTGSIHIGNYFGALKSWVNLINSKPDYNFIFCAVDLHSITVWQNPNELRQAIQNVIKLYIACGVDISLQNVHIFQQSKVAAHAQAAWLINCVTPIGWLNRMTQFKEKSAQNKENASCGLYVYPNLMAADILLYNTNLVPVGDDQTQHVELARDIAKRFNSLYNKNFFVMPEILLSKQATRIMSLQDGTKKMSKSDQNPDSRIEITDSKDEIARKIRKCKTDSVSGIYYNKESRPEVSNLIEIFAAASNKTKESIEDEYKESSTGTFKQSLTDALVACLEPIQKNLVQINSNQGHVTEALKQKLLAVNSIAEEKLKQMKEIMGIL